MHYAENKCLFKDNDDGLIEITGPYVDRVGERTVIVGKRGLGAYRNGVPIEDSLYYLSSDDITFLICGLSPSDWEE